MKIEFDGEKFGINKAGANGDKCPNDNLKIIGIDESLTNVTSGMGPNDTELAPNTNQVKICGKFNGTIVYTLKDALDELRMLLFVNSNPGTFKQTRKGFQADMTISL